MNYVIHIYVKYSLNDVRIFIVCIDLYIYIYNVFVHMQYINKKFELKLFFTLSGSGTLFILDVTPNGIVPTNTFHWNEGLFDITWAENNENVLVTAGGDGSVLVWDVTQPQVYTMNCQLHKLI